MLIFGDCNTALLLIEPESVDLIIADPPYGNLVNKDWDKIDDYPAFSQKWLDSCRRVLKPAGSIYVWCSIGEKSSSLIDIAAILKNDWHFRDMIVWAKQRGRGNRRGWLFTREEILWATKGKEYVWNREHQYSGEKYHESWIKRLGKEENPYKRATNVWKDIEEPTIAAARASGGRGKRDVLHINQKPAKALERIILAHTAPDDLVLDPFAGSGETGIVAAALNRKFIMVEKDRETYDKMCDRFKAEKLIY